MKPLCLLLHSWRFSSRLLQRITSSIRTLWGSPQNRVKIQGNLVPHAGRALARSPSASSF